MNTKYLFIFLLSCALLGLGGCGNDFPAEYPEYQPFFRLSPDKMKMAIFNFSLDQQIDLMIIAWTRTHPPYIFWSLVARNGEPILPLLFQRIADSDDLSTLRPLALCLHDVDKWNFEWTTQPKYVEMFEKAISGKWDPKIQREFLAILDTGVPHPFFKGLKHGKKVNK